MKKTVIKGTGRFVPSRLVSNKDLCERLKTSDEWIQQRTGIKQRYWIPEKSGIGASDLGLEASKIALNRSGWKPEDLDLIIFATLSPDVFFPGSGCFLQYKLGLKDTPTLDIRQQCTGFLYGIVTADAYIKSGLANRILLVGAEVQSTGLDISIKGKNITPIFGDGAGAVCLEGIDSTENIGIISSSLHTDGSLAESLMTEIPSSKINPRITKDMIQDGRHYPKMNGKIIFKTAIKRLPEVTMNVLNKANLSIDDIDLFIPHQANLRINQAFAKSINVDFNKVYNNICNYGNTTAASIPLALDDAIEKNIVVKGSTVLFLGLGAGVTWGAVIHKFET